MGFLSRLFKGRPRFPTLTAAFEPDRLYCSFDWPDPSSLPTHVAENFARSVALGLMVMTGGDRTSLASLKRSIGAAAYHRNDKIWASMVIECVDFLQLQRAAEDDGGVIQPSMMPSEVFKGASQ
jgi:hypothetical protein